MLPSIVNASVKIIDNGVPQGVILITPNAPDSVQFAADELQQHLYKMTGAQIDIRIEVNNDNKNAPVIISLGETEFALKHGVSSKGLPPDGFRIREAGGAMVITGKDHKGLPLGDRRGRLKWTYNKRLKINAHGETGTQFGVYRFLRDQGIRWYMPGEIGLIVPSKKNVVFNSESIEDAPQFTYRVLQGFSFDEDPEAAIWYKRIGYGSIRYVNLNHSFTDWAKKFSNTHPEYFAKINGKYHFKIVHDKKRVSLNYTEPGVLDQVVTDAGKYFSKNKGEPLFAIVPNDSHHEHDESPGTLRYITREKYSPGWLSDLVWGFVNKAAAEVHERYPGKKVGSLAYTYQFDAPTLIEKFSPNVVVMHCRRRSQFWDEDYKQYVQNNLLEFTKLGPSEQYIWEYYNLRSRDEKLQWVPFIMPRTIASDIYALKGISSGEFIQAKQSKSSWKLVHPGLYHLNLYVTGRFLWNPDLNVEELLDEYYKLYYGEAAQPMSQFWNQLEKIWASQNKNLEMVKPIGPKERYLERKGLPKYYWKEVYSSEVVKELFKHLDNAKKMVEDNAVYNERVSFIYAEFEPMVKMAR